MKTTAEHQKRVGLFVTVGIIVVCFSIFFVGGSEIFKSQYYLKARFKQIQGLTSGSIVSLSGIKIGNIEEVSLIPNETDVEVLIKVEKVYASKITQGSLIEIRTQGALGDKYLFIIPGPLDNPPVGENEILPTAPNTDLISVLSEKGDRATRVFEILDDVHKLTQALVAENHVARIPIQTELALQQMNVFLKEATLAIKDIRGVASPEMNGLSGPSQLSSVIKRLDSILGRIEKGEGTLGALINDTTIHDQLKAFLGVGNTTQQTRSLLRTSIKYNDTPSGDAN